MLEFAPFNNTETTHSLPISFLILNAVVNALGDKDVDHGVGTYTIHNKYLDSIVLHGDYADTKNNNTEANIFVIGY